MAAVASLTNLKNETFGLDFLTGLRTCPIDWFELSPPLAAKGVNLSHSHDIVAGVILGVKFLDLVLQLLS